MYKETNRHALT